MRSDHVASEAAGALVAAARAAVPVLAAHAAAADEACRVPRASVDALGRRVRSR